MQNCYILIMGIYQGLHVYISSLKEKKNDKWRFRSTLKARSQVQAKNWGQIQKQTHTHTHSIMYRLAPQVKTEFNYSCGTFVEENDLDNGLQENGI